MEGGKNPRPSPSSRTILPQDTENFDDLSLARRIPVLPLFAPFYPLHRGNQCVKCKCVLEKARNAGSAFEGGLACKFGWVTRSFLRQGFKACNLREILRHFQRSSKRRPFARLLLAQPPPAPLATDFLPAWRIFTETTGEKEAGCAERHNTERGGRERRGTSLGGKDAYFHEPVSPRRRPWRQDGARPEILRRRATALHRSCEIPLREERTGPPQQPSRAPDLALTVVCCSLVSPQPAARGASFLRLRSGREGLHDVVSGQGDSEMACPRDGVSARCRERGSLARGDLTELENLSSRSVSLTRPRRYIDRKWDLSRLVGSGGMPSSHSAFVSVSAVVCLCVREREREGLRASRASPRLRCPIPP